MLQLLPLEVVEMILEECRFADILHVSEVGGICR